MRTIPLILAFCSFAFAVITSTAPHIDVAAKQDLTQPLVQQMLLASR